MTKALIRATRSFDSKDAGFLSGFRNKIINGNFDIWQRGNSLSGAGYGADRWYQAQGTGAAISTAWILFPPGQTDVPGNPLRFLRFNRTVAGSTGSYIVQKIESVHTFSGMRITVTFYAKSSLPTEMQVFLQQRFGDGGSPVVTIDPTQTVNLTSSWQRFSLVFDIPSIAGKTVGASDCFEVVLFRPHNATNPTATIDIARVSAVEGDATQEDDPFSPRHIQQELALCQRYYSEAVCFALITAAGASNYVAGTAVTPVTMRITPTATLVGEDTGNVNVSSASIDRLSPDGGRVFATSLAAGSALVSVRAKFDAEF